MKTTEQILLERIDALEKDFKQAQAVAKQYELMHSSRMIELIGLVAAVCQKVNRLEDKKCSSPS